MENVSSSVLQLNSTTERLSEQTCIDGQTWAMPNLKDYNISEEIGFLYEEPQVTTWQHGNLTRIFSMRR